jgi:hypothetical protein
LLDTADWSRAQLGEEGLDFLRGFQPTVQAGDVLCCHATPRSTEDVILPETDRAELERALADVEASAVAAGHVHHQWLRRVNGKLWFCVGSVGLFWEYEHDPAPFLPWSEYAIVSDELQVSFRRIPFDVEELIAAAKAADFPHVETWAAMWQR